MSDCTFYIARRVEFHETDAAGLMHFSNFYRWMEICEHEWFRSQGILIMRDTNEGTRYGWPRRDATCNFIRPLRLGDLVRVSARIKKVNDTSLTYDFTFEKDRAGKWTTVASGTMTTVHVKQNKEGLMESEPFPTAIHAILNPTTKLPNENLPITSL
jgi:acyl-CoA thioester hydrolase